MIFPYAEKGDQFQRNGKGAKDTSAATEQRPADAGSSAAQLSVCNETSVQSQSEAYRAKFQIWLENARRQ